MYGSIFPNMRWNKERNSNDKRSSREEDNSSTSYYQESPWELPGEPQISLPAMHAAGVLSSLSGRSSPITAVPVAHGHSPLLPHKQNQSKSETESEGEAEEHQHGTGTGTGQATILSCIINLVNTIVGAGMLGLPGALGGTGYIGGSILIVLGASFSAHGLLLLSKAAQSTRCDQGPSSFYTVARAAVPQFTILIDLAVAMKCFGVATGYLITVGDCMVNALDHILLNGDPTHDNQWWIQTVLSRQFWVVGAVLALLPVSFYKTLDELKKASALALVFVFFLAFGIVAYANGWADPCWDSNNSEQQQQECRGDFVPFTDVPTTVGKLPIFIFAFTCHQNIFPVVNEIQHRTQERINLVIGGSIGFAFILFYMVAMEGYKTFGSNVRGDILLNYPETANVTALRFCIAFMLTLHYPLQLDPSRRCIMSLMHAAQEKWMNWKCDNSGTCNNNNDQQLDWYPTTSNFTDADADPERVQKSLEDDVEVDKAPPTEQSSIINASVYDDNHTNNNKEDARPHEDSTHNNNNTNEDDDDDDKLFYVITISFLLLSFLIAMIVDDLGVILALVGATGSTLVSYVLPGLIYIKIHDPNDASKIGAYIQLIMGCLIMPIALYFVMTGKVKH